MRIILICEVIVILTFSCILIFPCILTFVFLSLINSDITHFSPGSGGHAKGIFSLSLFHSLSPYMKCHFSSVLNLFEFSKFSKLKVVPLCVCLFVPLKLFLASFTLALTLIIYLISYFYPCHFILFFRFSKLFNLHVILVPFLLLKIWLF